ncbi:hypothetical protein BO86DRAFT_88885 [Aspergillus japonicus CBS 114.51]|uniref:Uncharacterized protein n=1 Tax=Aspergillus japonicus CBS 114.51 TaxID=1448312 RepID=A0A8T8X3B3_ASPJA|nr:hypothetical protein BO86DRAFT_88885 [Aspergillus japonicus CBS 114.51]RAH82122.1 hypothetical protein BO86DRAFT_88885 [Aspergillus japonicus CBS 114.51]
MHPPAQSSPTTHQKPATTTQRTPCYKPRSSPRALHIPKAKPHPYYQAQTGSHSILPLPQQHHGSEPAKDRQSIPPLPPPPRIYSTSQQPTTETSLPDPAPPPTQTTRNTERETEYRQAEPARHSHRLCIHCKEPAMIPLAQSARTARHDRIYSQGRGTCYARETRVPSMHCSLRLQKHKHKHASMRT